ncbi:glycosyltransferase family 2 protein [Coniophora puteana RWD-64-598 SS2]|uniref:chitin synthase n=1 Tax=Coniophora puteana (strain RWD-64-598) TaxID=741705 RepID=A0A5M3MLU1_CONPW|nr:glycosyltransferase family 2 protein [Coniophora puteana RWD-64-598 SS2]EIW79950.1 glycosyltransferase family 2 protein [Coniophora puteana RWD-64-598 SS2]
MNRQSTGMSLQRLESVNDLATLSPVSDDIIVTCIRERFMSDNIYTAIGSNAIVAVNPHKYVSSNADSLLHKYAADYRNTQDNKTPLPPHIFQLANDAYFHMRRTTQDQSLLISGETGSGKSENRRLAIKTLLELSVSNPGKKGSKLASQVPAAEFVIESFGNARTLFNPNASRYGKYTELQFTERGRLCGVKTLDYYLERNRVAAVPSGERNFHIFYYLVAGATTEERQHLRLVDKAAYRYLGQRNIGAQNGVRDDDANRFEQLKGALKSIGFSKRSVAQTCQLLAAILHLGNLEFTIDRGRDVDAAVVRNTDTLAIVAEFLGVQPAALEATLSYKTKMVKKELCTVFLDTDGASDNRDDLAKTLYSLLFAWLNEHINSRLCRDDFDTFIGLVDLPGPQNMTSRPNSLDQFCINFANERLQNFIQKQIFEYHVTEYTSEGVAEYVPTVPYFDNSECLRLLQNQPGGLIHIMDDQARRSQKKTDQSMVEAFGRRWGNHSSFKVGSMDRSGFPTFTVNHFNGPVTYSAEGFLERNLDALNPDFVSLLRGSLQASDGVETSGSVNPFVKGLFTGKAIATQAHPKDEDTIVAAQQTIKPMRKPSTRRKGTIRRRPTQREGTTGAAETIDEDDDDAGPAPNAGSPCVAGEFRSALDTLFETLGDTQNWFVFCVNPNDSQLPNQIEGRSVKGQVRSACIAEVARRNVTVFEAGMTPEEFVDRYREALTAIGIGAAVTPLEAIAQARDKLGLTERDLVTGTYKVFLTHAAFHALENHLRSLDTEEQKRNRMRDAEAEAGLDVRSIGDIYAPYASPGGNHDLTDPFSSQQNLPLVQHAAGGVGGGMYDDYDDERHSLRSDDYDARSRLTSNREDTASHYGSESYAPSRNMFQNADKEALVQKEMLPGEVAEGETTEVVKETSARRRWVMLTWMLTFWVPTPFLTWFGRMKRPDVRQAWREKLAINMLIWFICGCAVFVIAIMGLIICPTEHVYSTSELQSHSYQNSPNNVYTSIRGEVFDLTEVAATHQRIVSVVPTKSILQYGGTDASDIFPVQVSALCSGEGQGVSPWVQLNSGNTSDPNAQYHDFRAATNDSRPDWYFESMTVMRWNNRVGYMGYTPKEISSLANSGSSVGIIDGLVYDLTSYVNNGPSIQTPSGTQIGGGGTDAQFMNSGVVGLFKYNSGQDLSKQLGKLGMTSDQLAAQRTCLRNLFLKGMVDNRESPACQFSTYILLVLSIIMVSVIGFKFIASVNFGAARAPEDHDKFVICQVPCYTEGEISLRRTIDSLAQLKYDDKRKLILVICDGNIVGSGNDRPTPRIVLDILGADPNIDPEPLSFLSLGEGVKQHNMGKVYSGLYECAGHVVPYLVVVKTGKPSERSRPGNRGKRDSQMVIMRFFNKVHFNTPMNPLELEMYHQIKNVIGVNPTFYEYLFTVDADTSVEPHGVNRLISAMIRDKKLLGVCGETELLNPKQSLITMMQVYEYFISHHMAKAFESLFGSVTCLPGCFTLYRLRTPDTHKPLLIANQMIEDYSENRVDTLHMKNLLHLGEDRYLTTLLLKHFPLFKTQFVRDAHAWTVAPDDWKILLSQRRRWINSTVHNMSELIFADNLCGFCCFSMRFIVMVDLLSTIVGPVTVGYIVYLIVSVVTKKETIPIISLVMIGAIYGLQALVFILRRKWDMVGWMLFYILAIPVFTFLLPLYSFWRMDDFSWGATRLVLGESGKKIIVHDEGKFDPRAIPLKSWTDYENELWDKESNHSIGSWVPPSKFGGGAYAETHTASVYGRETFYDPVPARGQSPAPSQFNMMPPLGYNQTGFNSGRNTPMSQIRPMSEMGAMGPMAGNMSMYGGMGGMGGMQGMQGSIYQPAPSRPGTNYFDMPIAQQPTGGGTPQGHFDAGAAGGPSDVELEQAVQNVLASADLNTVTKRAVRTQLEEHFGMDLTPRKQTINAAIDRVLLSHA